MTDSEPIDNHSSEQEPQSTRREAPQQIQDEFMQYLGEKKDINVLGSNKRELLAVTQKGNWPKRRSYYLYAPRQTPSTSFIEGDTIISEDRKDSKWASVNWQRHDGEIAIDFLSDSSWENQDAVSLEATFPHTFRVEFNDGKVVTIDFTPYVLNDNYSRAEVKRFELVDASKETLSMLPESFPLPRLYEGESHVYEDEYQKNNARYDSTAKSVVIQHTNPLGESITISIPRFYTTNVIDALNLRSLIDNPVDAPTTADDVWREANPFEVLGIKVE